MQKVNQIILSINQMEGNDRQALVMLLWLIFALITGTIHFFAQRINLKKLITRGAQLPSAIIGFADYPGYFFMSVLVWPLILIGLIFGDVADISGHGDIFTG